MVKIGKMSISNRNYIVFFFSGNILMKINDLWAREGLLDSNLFFYEVLDKCKRLLGMDL